MNHFPSFLSTLSLESGGFRGHDGVPQIPLRFLPVFPPLLSYWLASATNQSQMHESKKKKKKLRARPYRGKGDRLITLSLPLLGVARGNFLVK